MTTTDFIVASVRLCCQDDERSYLAHSVAQQGRRNWSIMRDSGVLDTTLAIAVEVIMSTPMPHVNETAVLSSLCGMTLAGLHAMCVKTANAPIRHLILDVIEIKEKESNEAGTHARKPRSKRTKRLG
jgi:hypothetical protein